jgi:malonate transporter
MATPLDIIVPVFLAMGCGYMAGKIRLTQVADAAVLNAFVYWIALPAILFKATASQPLSKIVEPSFLAVILVATLLTYATVLLAGMVRGRGSSPTAYMRAFAASFGNTGYMGIPLFLVAFGPDRLGPAILVTVVVNTINIIFTVLGLEWARRSGPGQIAGLRAVAIACARNPLIVAPLAGLAWWTCFHGLFRPIAGFCDLMGSAAGPCALFAIGLSLSGQRLRAGLGEALGLSLFKLIYQPVICWLLILVWFPMDPFWTEATILIAALPTGSVAFVLSQKYGIYTNGVASAVLVSTAFSLPILLAILAGFAIRP